MSEGVQGRSDAERPVPMGMSEALQAFEMAGRIARQHQFPRTIMQLADNGEQGQFRQAWFKGYDEEDFEQLRLSHVEMDLWASRMTEHLRAGRTRSAELMFKHVMKYRSLSTVSGERELPSERD